MRYLRKLSYWNIQIHLCESEKLKITDWILWPYKCIWLKHRHFIKFDWIQMNHQRIYIIPLIIYIINDNTYTILIIAAYAIIIFHSKFSNKYLFWAKCFCTEREGGLEMVGTNSTSIIHVGTFNFMYSKRNWYIPIKKWITCTRCVRILT